MNKRRRFKAKRRRRMQASDAWPLLQYLRRATKDIATMRTLAPFPSMVGLFSGEAVARWQQERNRLVSSCLDVVDKAPHV